MFFIDFSDIKFETFLNYNFHEVNEIGSKKNINKVVDNHFGTGVVRVPMSFECFFAEKGLQGLKK